MSTKLRLYLRKCRLCLKKAVKSKLDENAAQLISAIAGIQLTDDHRLSNSICSECHRNIITIRKFIAMLIENQKILETHLEIEKKTEEHYEEDLVMTHEIQQEQETVEVVENLESSELVVENEILEIVEIIREKPSPVKSRRNRIMRTTNDYPDKKCPICGKQFTEKRKIPLHIRRMHTKVKDYQCDECDYSTYTKFDITRHIKNIHLPKTDEIDDSKRICPHCGKVVHGNSQLTLHINRKHLNIKKFKCDSCPFASYGKYEMRYHQEHYHIPKEFQTLFRCTLCTSVLSTAVGLKVHYNHKHSGLRPFKCDECSKTFSLKETLKTHVRNVHQHERKFACEICPKKYGQAVRLRDHMANEHGEKQKFECPECDKIFHSKRNLKTHLIYHREPRYPCSKCIRRFYIRSRLKRHLEKDH